MHSLPLLLQPLVNLYLIPKRLKLITVIPSIEAVVKYYLGVPTLNDYGLMLLYCLCLKHTKVRNSRIVNYIGITPDKSLLTDERFKLDIDTIEASYLRP